MTKGINVLALVKGKERYIFLYDDASCADTLRTIDNYVAHPGLSFDQDDADVLKAKVKKGLYKKKRATTPHHPLYSCLAQRFQQPPDFVQ